MKGTYVFLEVIKWDQIFSKEKIDFIEMVRLLHNYISYFDSLNSIKPTTKVVGMRFKTNKIKQNYK